MILAFVLLADDRLPKEQDVVSEFTNYATGEQRLVPMPATEASAKGALAFELHPAGTGLVVGMPAPVPEGEAEKAARFSVSALGTGWTLPEHKSHLAVVLHGTENCSAVDALSAFTSFVAAVAAASNSVGVYWGGAGATHDVEFLKSVAQEPGITPRIMLWNGVGIGNESDGRLGLLSMGMKQLGLPNLYLRTRESEGNDALAVFFDLLSYLAERGEPLPDGDTVGRTADEHLPVRYVPSPIDPSVEVWLVELP